jgi:hypothetical protein
MGLRIIYKITTLNKTIMKKILLFILLLSATSVSAQDMIVKMDGTTIQSKVIEIGTSEVKYKKFSNQNGPTYTITKTEIYSIIYENGEKETFSDADKAKSQMSFNGSDQTTENKLRKERLLTSSKVWGTIGSVWFWVNLLGGLGAEVLLCLNKEFDIAPYVGIGCIGSGFIGLLVCRGISGSLERSANEIASTPIIKHDFELGNSRLSAGINLMNDKLHNDYAIGLGLNIKF